MDQRQQWGTPFYNSGAGASGSVTITRTAVVGRAHKVTDISGSVTTNSTAVIELSSSGTIFWQDRIGDSAYRKEFVVPISIPTGSAITLVVNRGDGGGTAYGNMSGYFVG